jgi:hypothetical protein
MLYARTCVPVQYITRWCDHPSHWSYSVNRNTILILVSIAAKNEAILAGEKEPWCGLRDGLLQG